MMHVHPLHGAGIGMRADYLTALLSDKTPSRPMWLELLADNHFHPEGMKVARALADRYPVTLHCVGMNLGDPDGVDLDYLDRVADIARDIQPRYISDHVAFTAVGNRHHHDLWPLPHNCGVAEIVAENVQRVQDRLGQQLLIENISTYMRPTQDTLTEGDFLKMIVDLSGCGVLIDLNNLWVNQHNHHISALETMWSMPLDTLGYVHIAGHTEQGSLLVDTHNQPPCDGVWSLLTSLLNHYPNTPVLLEWDDALPTYDIMGQHIRRAQVAVDAAYKQGA